MQNINAIHLCVDQGEKENHTAILHPCHGHGTQLGRYTTTGEFFLGALGSTGEDTRCLMDDKVSSFPQLVKCETLFGTMQTIWHFSKNESILN